MSKWWILSAIVLMTSAQIAMAQQGPPPGFNPFGSKPGGAAPAAPDDDFFDDEDDLFDEEDDELTDQMLRQRVEQRLKDRAGNTPPPAKGGGKPGVDFGQQASSVGASLPGGATTKIAADPGRACLKLDVETGYGPDVITNFDFPDADIMEIAKTLGRLTCLNFLFDKDVKGRISIVSNAAITVGDAWKAFLTALDVNGYSIIPSGKYMRIARQRDAKDKQIRTYSGDYTPDTDLFITRVMPMKYISAEEVRRVFSTFMPPNTRMVAYDQTNTLIVTDTGSNIKRLTEMIKVLDIESYDEKLEVIRIRYASSQEISKLIDQLLPGSKGAGGPGGAPRFGNFSARRTKEGGIISNIIPDDRTNAVIISANAKGLEQVRELIRKLDAKVSVSQGGSRIHVVYLQFADAEQVEKTLTNLVQGSGARTTAPIAGAGSSTAASLFEGSVRISADKPTNSLVITGSPSDFGTIQRVLAKLDVPRDQVYVEAIVVEIAISKGFELGGNLALPSSGIGVVNNPTDFFNFLTNPFALQGLVLGFKQGQSKTLEVPNGTGTTKVEVSSVQGLIRAMQANSSANLLATPQILTLDNQEASIEITENVPTPSVTSVQGAGVTQGLGPKEKVSLSLKIKPQINKISNFVKLDIDQKQEDFSERQLPKSLQDLAFATLTRSSKTTVVVQDGDTVALGGLVRDKVSETSRKVPLLGDIPILGWLFSSKTTSTSKQNLLVFITPKIIKQYQHIRKVLDKKLRERDEFIERNLGGTDPFQKDKMTIIKSLPPVETLRTGERIENEDIDTFDEEPKPDEDPLNPGASERRSLRSSMDGALKAEAPKGGQAPVPPELMQPHAVETAPTPAPASKEAPPPAALPTSPPQSAPTPAAPTSGSGG